MIIIQADCQSAQNKECDHGYVSTGGQIAAGGWNGDLGPFFIDKAVRKDSPERPDASHAVASSPAGQARHHAGGANGHGGTSGGKGYGQSTTSRVNSGAQSAKYGWVTVL
jgi:hypothetical protein